MSTRPVAVFLTPEQKRAIGHFAVEQDINQKDALLRLVLAGLEAHFREHADCEVVAHMAPKGAEA